jgi:hypothetical protein
MGERPINLAYDPPPGVSRSTGVPEAHRMTIYNVRSVAARLSLDGEGLALVTPNTVVHDFYDEDELRRVYYPEAERLVAEVTGATRVLVFDHTAPSRLGRRRPVGWDAASAGHRRPQRLYDYLRPATCSRSDGRGGRRAAQPSLRNRQ